MNPFSPLADTHKYRRHLPHWRQHGATYFVTFRLHDSIPRNVWERFCEERINWLQRRVSQEPAITTDSWKESLSKLSNSDREEYHRLYHQRIDSFLDTGVGACWLRQPRIGTIVSDTMQFFDGDRYLLGDFVIMPNHVHALVTPTENWRLEKITHSWKSYTAKEINRALDRGGQFWQRESFDHIVRNDRRLDDFRSYIAENPRKAGLRSGEYFLHLKAK